jgi:hypothetical protein
MVGEIAAALTSLKAAGDIAKAMMDLRDASAFQGKAIELQRQILSAQESALAANAAQTTLVDRIRDLEQEIVHLKDWEGEKQRYHLQAIDRGAFAYLLKPGMEEGEPPHWLCANCFNRRQKSFLQFQGQDRKLHGGRADTSTYGCVTCKASLKVSYLRNPLTPWAPS